MRKTKEKFHNFYSYSKQCRKTAYDTPEYLNENDKVTLTELIHCLQTNDISRFHALARGNNNQGLFWRILGWPEGLNYCYDYEFCVLSAMPGLIRHELPKLLAGVPVYTNQGENYDYTI